VYTSEVHTMTFNMNEAKDLNAYSGVINNPLNVVLAEITEKLSDREMQDGQVSSIQERLVKVVTWKEKKLM
jgi:hypothetical protein